MGLENVVAAFNSIFGFGGFGGGVGYYVALAGIGILLVAGLFVGGVLVARGLRSIGEMEPGEFARFLILSSLILIGLGAILP